WSNEREEPRRGLLSVPASRISSFTMSSLFGCAGSIRTSRSYDTRMTPSAIAEAKHGRVTFVRRFEMRFPECELRPHPEKTKIVYCKDANRSGCYPVQVLWKISPARAGGGVAVSTSVGPSPATSASLLQRSQPARAWPHLKIPFEIFDED